MSIRVIIVDDHRIVMAGLTTLIAEESDMEVVATAREANSAVEAARSLEPDIVLMDLSLPGRSGIEAIRTITRDVPGTRIIVLSMHSEKMFVRAAFEAGARGYIVKENAYEELARGIRNVYGGGEYLCPVATKAMVHDYMKNVRMSEGQRGPRDLTPRELEVLRQLAEGSNTKEVAGSLGISVKTVETHRKNMMDKLDIRSVAGLTRYAIREGIVTL